MAIQLPTPKILRSKQASAIIPAPEPVEQLLTVAEAEAKIAQVQADQQAIKQRLSEIEGEIAANWDGDSHEIEAEAARLSARLKASETTIALLQAARREALKRDFLATFETDCTSAQTHRQTMAQLGAEIQAVQAQLADLQAQYNAEQMRYRAAFDRLIYAPAQFVDQQLDGNRAVLIELNPQLQTLKAQYGVE